MNINQIDEQIEKLQKKKQEILLGDKVKTIEIKELNIEVEYEGHSEMNYVSKIEIPKGWRLLTLSEFLHIYNNYQDKFNWGMDKYADEIVKQPIKKSEKDYPYWNVWFRRLDGSRSGLNGNNRLLDNGYDRVRGVRFARDLK
jgi:hypothetical protein